MKMWKKAASVNPELIDKRENLSVDSGLFFGVKHVTSWNSVINLEIVL